MRDATSDGKIARLRESEERIHDPASIDAKLSSLTTDQRSTLWKLYRGSRRALTRGEMASRAKLVGLFRDTATEIEADIFSAFNRLPGETWDYGLVRRIGRDKELLDQVNDRIGALGYKVEGSLSDDLIDQFKQTWIDGAYRLDALTPASANIRFGLLPDREIIALLDTPWSGARFSQRLGLINNDMAARIKSQILRSMMAEESWSDTARRIRDEMGAKGQRSVWRAEMVARTELAHAQTTANMMVYADNADVIEKIIWIAHPGACPKCLAKHGKSVLVVGYPPEDSHPNCVCDILAVTKPFDKIAKPGDPAFKAPPSRASWVEDKTVAGMLQ